jgi:hypothetical protein
MTGSLRWTHTLVGLGTVAVFLVTGLFMKVGFPALYGGDEIVRYQYRANHVYILMAGLIHVMAAQARGPALDRGWRRKVSRGASFLLLGAPVVLIWAFFSEAPQGGPEKPLTLLGAVLLLAGAGLSGVAAIRPSKHY